MNNKEERQIETRAKIIQELFEWSEELNFGKLEVQPNKDVQTYGLLITLIASIFVIWYGGKPNHDLTIILGMFAMLIGGLLIFAGEILLASKIRQAIKFYIAFFSDKFKR